MESFHKINIIFCHFAFVRCHPTITKLETMNCWTILRTVNDCVRLPFIDVHHHLAIVYALKLKLFRTMYTSLRFHLSVSCFLFANDSSHSVYTFTYLCSGFYALLLRNSHFCAFHSFLYSNLPSANLYLLISSLIDHLTE